MEVTMLELFKKIEADNKKENFYPIDDLVKDRKFNDYINNESELLAIDNKFDQKEMFKNKMSISEIKFDSKNYFLSLNDEMMRQIKFIKIRKESFKKIYSTCF